MAPAQAAGLRVAAVLAAGLLAGTLSAAGGGARQAGPDRWSQLERELLAELNRARVEPPRYARHLRALLSRFEGELLRREDGGGLLTDEGPAAVAEAAAALERTRPMRPLKPVESLAAAARDHVRDQGGTGATGHRGRDGSFPFVRAARRGAPWRRITECIVYGEHSARDAVIQLLADDGVADRGHRRALLDRRARWVGVACGPHATYGQSCVIELAGL